MIELDLLFEAPLCSYNSAQCVITGSAMLVFYDGWIVVLLEGLR